MHVADRFIKSALFALGNADSESYLLLILFLLLNVVIFFNYFIIITTLIIYFRVYVHIVKVEEIQLRAVLVNARACIVACF